MDRQSSGILPVQYRENAEGLGTVSGVVVAYGDIARLGVRTRERFEPGSLELYKRGVMANVQHRRDRPVARYPDAGLRFVRTRQALRTEIDLPDTSDGRDAWELVKRRVLTGLSLEFRAGESDVRQDGDTLVVQRGIVTGVALVDTPAYPKSTLDKLRGALEADLDDPALKRVGRRLWL